MGERIISVDIGSTYTKGALFELEGGRARALLRADCPTTREDLGLGFGRVAARLLGGEFSGRLEDLATDVPVRFSSSAKGGLRIAAVGIVPDLTLQVAKLAAWSAGARIVGHSSYRLTSRTLEGLLAEKPDIIFITGGTDGGNEHIVLSNLRTLAASSYEGTVLYAGNSDLRDEAESILSGKTLCIADNVMPEIGTLRIEPAREMIQRIFLETIVAGKGLDRVRDYCKADPKPTPVGVYDLTARIGELRRDWTNFCVVDLGGATTDFYSNGEAFAGSAHGGTEDVILKGIREPKVKRSVEGDLGLRVSVEPLFSAARERLETALGGSGIPMADLEDYVRKAAADTGYRPETEKEKLFDELLAREAAVLAALRHAGRIEESYTPAGKIYLQSGKDLRDYGRMILTGGFLSRDGRGALINQAFGECRGPDGAGRIPLIPERFRCFRDGPYLFPLLGNLVGEYPEEAVSSALENLVEV
jgi:uncharacterized protein (TIGR01319 family)